MIERQGIAAAEAATAGKAAVAKPTAASSGFRPDLQALRAFAIIAVTLFHLWPKSFGGGFVGVDVFFVISGFLITGALWREVEANGKVRFAAFWARRARRLLPASLLVILTSAVVSLVILMPIGWLAIKDEIFSSTFYVENFALLGKQTDYLAAIADPSPYQHFWSLSVEEQFYLAWPLVIFAALLVAGRKVARRHRSIVLLLAAIAVSSFAFNVWQTYQLQPVAYFSTFARAWEFTVGGLVAVWLGRSAEIEARRRPWWFIAGALAVFYSATMFDKTTLFPGVAAALPVLGSAALIYAGQSKHFMMPRRFIALKPWRFLGDISYSLYLWHWPLIVLLPLWLDRDLNNAAKILVFVLAIGLAWVTKRFVEDPIRFGRIARLSALRQIGLALVSMAVTAALVAGLGLVANKWTQNSWASTHLHPALLDLHSDWSSIEKNENCVSSPSSTDFKVCEQGDANGTRTVALIGDSHARQIFDAVNAISIQNGYRLFVISKSHCEPMASEVFPADYSEPTCRIWNQKLEQYLSNRAPFDLIVNMNASIYSVSSNGTPDAFKALVQSQLARGSKWLVVKDNPLPMSNLPKCLDLYDQLASFECSVTPEVGFKKPDLLAEVIRELPGVIYADFSDIFCTTTLCPPFVGSDIVYRDTNHLTRTFTEKYMQPRLEALLSKELSE